MMLSAVRVHRFFSVKIYKLHKNKVAKPLERERETHRNKISICTGGGKAALFLLKSGSSTALLFKKKEQKDQCLKRKLKYQDAQLISHSDGKPDDRHPLRQSQALFRPYKDFCSLQPLGSFAAQ